MLTDEQQDQDRIAAWLSLRHTPNLPARAVLRLLRYFGRPRAILTASAQDLAAAVGEEGPALRRRLDRPDQRAIERDVEWLRRDCGHVVTWADPHYPALLRQIDDPPMVLYVRGQPDRLGAAQIAVVGSRNPSPAGRETAFELAHALAGCGITVTSGLALGIDAAAHRGALEGDGVTIGIAATGLDRVYPDSHRELAEQIVSRGAIVSEFPVGTAPRKAHFPQRNRLISGISLGTLVVEATVRSGSLITARFAAEQGREVYAVPGPIRSPLSRGCHALLRQGAKLVETAEDVIEELVGFAGTASPAAAAEPVSRVQREYTRLLDAMGFEPATADDIVRRSGLTAGAVCSILLNMELEGVVATCPGGKYLRLR